MSSLSETQQVFNLLTQIDKLLADIELKITKLQTDAPRTRELLVTFRQIERLTLRYLALTRRMGLPEDTQNAISFLMRLVTVIRMAQISISLMMASNPVTAAIGIAGLIGSAMTLQDSLIGY